MSLPEPRRDDPGDDRGTIVVEERAHPASPLVQLWIGVVAFGWFVLQELFSGDGFSELRQFRLTNVPWWGIALALFLLVGLGFGYWGWWTTKFVIDDRELRIENTGAFSESKRIAFGRIQAVDITQPFAARLLGLAELRIDVGASSDMGTKLSFLTRRRATEIRDHLLSRARAAKLDPGPAAAGPGGGAGSAAARLGGEAGPAAEGPSGEAGPAAVGPGGEAGPAADGPSGEAGAEEPPAQGVPARAPLSADTSRWDDLGADDRVLIRLHPGELIVGTLLALELWLMLLALLVPLAIGTIRNEPLLVGGGFIPILLAIAGFISQRLLKQFNYTLAETASGLRITRGLTTLTSQTIPVHRVQSIRVSQPILWRWLGRSRVNIVVLGSLDLGSDEGSTSTLLLPIGDREQVRTALHSVWPGVELDGLAFTGPPARARWLDPLTHRWMGYALTGEVVVVRNGFLNRRTSIIPHARLQSATLHQGPLERRLDVANVQLATAELMGLGNQIAHMDGRRARSFVFEEMDRARTSRVVELYDPAGMPTDRVPGAAGGPAAGRWHGQPVTPSPAGPRGPASPPTPAVMRRGDVSPGGAPDPASPPVMRRGDVSPGGAPDPASAPTGRRGDVSPGGPPGPTTPT